jgi:hypothetical protein
MVEQSQPVHLKRFASEPAANRNPADPIPEVTVSIRHHPD